jgi:preprotein translocase subunit SecG
MTVYLNLAQILIGAALITAVVLQAGSSSMSGVFGGSGGSFHRTRRGVERTVFIITVVLAVAFFAVSLFNALMQSPG